jgi:hypothetical protein
MLPLPTMRRALMVLASVTMIAVGATPARAQSFIIECKPSHFVADDPIVFPGVAGASHMHEFFGNTSTNASSTYATMTGKPTSCLVAGDTAGYWAPTLLNSAGQRIPPRRIVVYYRDRPQESRTVTPFPPDFRMIAGSPQVGVAGFNCDGIPLFSTSLIDCTGYPTPYVRASIVFPNCGQLDASGNIVTDSPDHRSHVAYPISARLGCPASHPVQLPHVKLNIRFNVANCIAAGCYLSSDMGRACVVKGCSLHADFWNTWNQQALIDLVRTKLNS